MDDLIITLTTSVSQELGLYSFILDNALGGAFCLLLLLFLIRFICRAMIYSWFGRQGGALISTLLEATAVIFMVASAWRNPGVIVAGLTWGALIFRSIVQGF